MSSVPPAVPPHPAQTSTASTNAMHLLLPTALLSLPLARLSLSAAEVGELATSGVLTVGDALQLPAATFEGDGLFAPALGPLRAALARALNDGLAQFAAAGCTDWPTLRAQLLGPLHDDERTWFTALVGLDGPPVGRTELARVDAVPLATIDERAERLRERLAEGQPALLARLHQELTDELAANDGVFGHLQIGAGTTLHALTHATDDRELGLRTAAFLFPREVHLHRGCLFGLSPRRFRRVLRQLPVLVPPHRLPLPIDVLLAELQADGQAVPRGALLHLLRSERQIAIELDDQQGEVAAADPRSPAARLIDVLLEARHPLQLADLVFAWRERFRTASTTAIASELRRHRAFVQVGPDLWSLRRFHERELADVAPLVDRAARKLCNLGGRHHITELLQGEGCDEATTWLVLDRLADDPRVRRLGRGELCPASPRRSRVLEQLLQDFRRAAGDVVLSMFLANQPAEHRRLVERLLRHNRLFVQPAADRVDTLANWPFNDERIRRLVALVQEQLRQRSGYVHVAALKTIVDRTDLGGTWLVPELLADVLRRNGPFEVLPGGLVARKDLDLAETVRRSLRQALREAGMPLRVDDVLRARPDLAEFADCLRGLLGADPLVQSLDGEHFVLA